MTKSLFYTNPFLLLVLISLLNQISIHFLSYLDIHKETISNGRIILYYTLFISGSFYVGSLISEGIVNIIEELQGFGYYSLLFQNSILIIFILSIFLVKIDTRLKSSVDLVLFAIFQVLFEINWIFIFNAPGPAFHLIHEKQCLRCERDPAFHEAGENDLCILNGFLYRAP